MQRTRPFYCFVALSSASQLVNSCLAQTDPRREPPNCFLFFASLPQSVLLPLSLREAFSPSPRRLILGVRPPLFFSDRSTAYRPVFWNETALFFFFSLPGLDLVLPTPPFYFTGGLCSFPQLPPFCGVNYTFFSHPFNVLPRIRNHLSLSPSVPRLRSGAAVTIPFLQGQWYLSLFLIAEISSLNLEASCEFVWLLIGRASFFFPKSWKLASACRCRPPNFHRTIVDFLFSLSPYPPVKSKWRPFLFTFPSLGTNKTLPLIFSSTTVDTRLFFPPSIFSPEDRLIVLLSLVAGA